MEILPFLIEEQGELITNYIIIPGTLPGKILPNKLKEFGIKGKLVGQLSKEGSVTVDGRTTQLDEVREESCPSPNVVLLHYR